MSENNENLRSLHHELEQAQMLYARKRGNLPPFDDIPWLPVKRIKASDEEVDALVNAAESELCGATSANNVVLITPKSKEGKTKFFTEKKRGKKLEKAIQIYKNLEGSSRKIICAEFVSKLNMSKAMASTYYQLVKSKFDSESYF